VQKTRHYAFLCGQFAAESQRTNFPFFTGKTVCKYPMTSVLSYISTKNKSIYKSLYLSIIYLSVCLSVSVYSNTNIKYSSLHNPTFRLNWLVFFRVNENHHTWIPTKSTKRAPYDLNHNYWYQFKHNYMHAHNNISCAKRTNKKNCKPKKAMQNAEVCYISYISR